MTPAQLAAALRAQARGLHCLKAAANLLIDHGHFLRRNSFAERFLHLGTSITDGVTKMAVLDWPATIAALDTGGLPCSGGEQRVLRLTASLAEGIPVDLRDGLTGLDQHNINLVGAAILHASGATAQIHDHH
jgi:hypothetical protein